MPVGILLAAGAGTRMGRPKALVCDADGTSWLLRSVRALVDGGCSPVIVVLGAEAGEARRLLEEADSGTLGPEDTLVLPVVTRDWADGMSASLRTGLQAARGLYGPGAGDGTTACVTLVDLPDVDGRVVRRVVTAAGEGISTLYRAAYDGVPGHPVILGRDHWLALSRQLSGDRGARDYLSHHAVDLVECADLATGDDVDT